MLGQEKADIACAQLDHFILKDGFFSKDNDMWGVIDQDPLRWWNVNCCSQEVKELFAVANRVLSIPATSAASERSWWLHSLIHSKRRAALSDDTVEKLVVVHGHYNAEECSQLRHSQFAASQGSRETIQSVVTTDHTVEEIWHSAPEDINDTSQEPAESPYVAIIVDEEDGIGLFDATSAEQSDFTRDIPGHGVDDEIDAAAAIDDTFAA